MNKKNNSTLIVTSLLCLIPFVISAIFYNDLPDMVATHFNNNGEPDGYSSKLVAAFGIPLFLLIVNIVSVLLVEKQEMNGRGGKTIKNIGIWTLPVVSIITEGVIIGYAKGARSNFCSYVIISLGFLFIIIGNYLPKCEYNKLIGIKTPWTLRSKDNWKKTHRISGYAWVLCGIILCINSINGIKTLNIFIIAAIAIIPFIASWLYAKKEV